MGDSTVLLTVLVVATGFVAFVFFAAKSVARTHDPSRAEHSVLIERDGSFLLEVPLTRRDPLLFRFELDEPSTDDDYDLLVTGEVEDQHGAVAPFAWKTKERSKIDGAEGVRMAGTYLAVTMRTATIELMLALPAGKVTVRGSAAQGSGTILKRAWVFLPP